MQAILLPLMRAAGKALIAMLMQLASEKFFKEIFIMLAEMAAKSSKTPHDDVLVAKIKEALEEK